MLLDNRNNDRVLELIRTQGVEAGRRAGYVVGVDGTGQADALKKVHA